MNPQLKQQRKPVEIPTPESISLAARRSGDEKRVAAKSLAAAVSLHLEGKPEEALKELQGAVKGGEQQAAVRDAALRRGGEKLHGAGGVGAET